MKKARLSVLYQDYIYRSSKFYIQYGSVCAEQDGLSVKKVNHKLYTCMVSLLNGLECGL